MTLKSRKWFPGVLGPAAKQSGNLEITDDLDIGGAITSVDTIQFNLLFEDGAVEGRLQWNSDDGTLEVGLPGGNVVMQIGQELPFRLKNDQGATVANGKLVYISGGSGSQALFKLADPDDPDASDVIGMTTEDITTQGYVTAVGYVRGNTEQPIDTSSWSPGTPLYLSDDGAFTDTIPTAPRNKVRIGRVIRQHASEGVILVGVHLLPTVGELSDVYIANTPSEGQILAWDAANARWAVVPGVSFDTTTGHLTLTGGAIVWDDLRSPALGQRVGASGAPDLVKFSDNGAGSTGVFLPHFDKALEEQQHFAVQLPHDWLEGSTIYPHVHWSPIDTGTGVVVWGLEYTWTNIDGTGGNTTIITVNDAGDGTAKKHQIADLPTISGTGKTHSSMLTCRIFRKAADAADTYDNDAALREVDFHYQRNQLGDAELP